MSFLDRLFGRTRNELQVIQNVYEKKLDKQLLELIKRERKKGTPDIIMEQLVLKFTGGYLREITDSYNEMTKSGRIRIPKNEYFDAINHSTAMMLKKHIDYDPPPFDTYLDLLT